MILTDRLATKLGLRPGDTVLAEVLEGRQRTLHLRVDATVQELMGLNATMTRTALNRALGEAAPSARPRCCATWNRSARATCSS